MVSEEFKKWVKDNNKRMIHIALGNYLIIDRSFKLSDESLSYALSKNMDIFVEHDGEKLITDKTKWTQDYLNELLITLPINFSKERYELAKQVARVVLGPNKNVVNKNFIEYEIRYIKSIQNNINVISKSESSVIKEIQSLKRDKDIEIKNVSKAVSYIEKQYSNILRKYTNILKLNTNED